jgi:hypothetical protein
MWRARVLAGAATLAMGAALVPASSSPAVAANSPTFRDCSLLLDGVDPDFVQLSGVTVTPTGSLTVPATATSLTIEASESNTPADQAMHDKFIVTVSAPNRTTQTEFGTGTGKVFLTLPLLGAVPGLTYTIRWQAEFDGGFHWCPGTLSPDNRFRLQLLTHPFVVTVV